MKKWPAIAKLCCTGESYAKGPLQLLVKLGKKESNNSRSIMFLQGISVAGALRSEKLATEMEAQLF